MYITAEDAVSEANQPKKGRMVAEHDWRNGVCKSCNVGAHNGCCPEHTMYCPMCRGFGAISDKQWAAIYASEYHKRNNPPNKCCNKCTAHFNHSVGSHSDDSDGTPCLCNKDNCAWIYCECHLTTLNDQDK